jgi:hypothetical protein
LQQNISQLALCQVGSWAIGEFGDLLINAQVDEVPITVIRFFILGVMFISLQVTEAEVLDLLYRVFTATTSNAVRSATPILMSNIWQTARQYAFTAIMKLSTRFVNSSDRIRSLVTLQNVYLFCLTFPRLPSSPRRTRLKSSSARMSTPPSSLASTTFAVLFSSACRLLIGPPLLRRHSRPRFVFRNSCTLSQLDCQAAKSQSSHSASQAQVAAVVTPAPVQTQANDLLDLLGDSTRLLLLIATWSTQC